MVRRFAANSVPINRRLNDSDHFGPRAWLDQVQVMAGRTQVSYRYATYRELYVGTRQNFPKHWLPLLFFRIRRDHRYCHLCPSTLFDRYGFTNTQQRLHEL